MRRIAAALLVPLAGCIVLAGCGSSGSSTGDANAAVKVTGQFDGKPTVSIPNEKPSTKLVVSTPIKGTGAELDSTSSVLAYVTLYKWSGTKHSEVVGSGTQMIPAKMGLPGLATALKDARIGSRIVAVLPPKYGWGTAGESQLSITGSDTTVWVLDLLQQYSPTQAAAGKQVSSGGGSLPTVSAQSGKAPVISIPKKTSPPAKLSVTTLIQGTGPKLVKGDTVVAQYVGSIWRNGKVFSSTWPSSSEPQGVPFSFQLGGQVLAGWNDGLVGVSVGSRVMLVIPPSLGYGPAGGQSSAGIEKNDTLVFVVDVLGVEPAAAS
jgi:FKBP-type peptidyl-prolyl cis-trans isomerase